MKEIETGGQAFPTIIEIEDDFNSKTADFRQEGMTLRDYFASQVLSGVNLYQTTKSIEDAVRYAYRVADAMIKQRGK